MYGNFVFLRPAWPPDLFAKIKEEMFMDYPKFNALVKAKEYEYCEIIKNQKVEIDVLK